MGSFFSTLGRVAVSTARYVADGVRSAYRGIVRGAEVAYETGKQLAKKAFEAAKRALVRTAVAIADHGHKFVDSAKRTWAAVKPHLLAVGRPVLAFLKDTLRGHPKLYAFVEMIDRVIDFSLKFFVGPIAAALEAAVRWTIDMITRLVNRYLRPDEWVEARRKRDLLRQRAAEIMQSHPEEANTLLIAAMFIDFELARAGVALALEEDTLNDFDQFLRLQAAQKLLEMAEHRLRITENLAELTGADYLIVELCATMLESGAEIDEQKLALLDDIVEEREGRKLLPFVFEKLLIAWAARITELARLHKIEKDKLKTLRKRQAVLKPKLRSGLSVKEEAEWARLPVELEKAQSVADAALSRKESMDRYVHAAEGYLIHLEKSDAELSATIDDIKTITATEIAPLLIRCAENETDWNDLEREDRNKIDRFAMIYEADFKARRLELEAGRSGELRRASDDSTRKSDPNDGEPDQPSATDQ